MTARTPDTIVVTRELYKGPRTLQDTVNEFSIDIPEGWIAGIDNNGLYGLEPISAGSEYIYVNTIQSNQPQVIKSMATQLQLAYIKLIPTSEVSVTNNLASAYFKIQGYENSRKVLLVATTISAMRNVLFAAISWNSISTQLKYTTLACANSTRHTGKKNEFSYQE